MNVPIMDSGPASLWQVTRRPSRSAVVLFPVPGGPTSNIRVMPQLIADSSLSHHFELVETDVTVAGFMAFTGVVTVLPIAAATAALIIACISGVLWGIGSSVSSVNSSSGIDTLGGT